MNYQLAFQILLVISFLVIPTLVYAIKRQNQHIDFLNNKLDQYSGLIVEYQEVINHAIGRGRI